MWVKLAVALVASRTINLLLTDFLWPEQAALQLDTNHVSRLLLETSYCIAINRCYAIFGINLLVRPSFLRPWAFFFVRQLSLGEQLHVVRAARR
ncbi:hypothetical protein C8R47DRAFT_1156263 [Mycena vitilis]|nr:hypothetical protein C8R47DRAFT_1156263 [Mycena vitilis]